jgi:AbrB family looped-hinge helix DNA binding protein
MRAAKAGEGGDELMNEAVLMPRIATVSSKLQVTLPAAFRRKYHLKPGDKVQLEVRNGRIILTPYRSMVEEIARTLVPRRRKERR